MKMPRLLSLQQKVDNFSSEKGLMSFSRSGIVRGKKVVQRTLLCMMRVLVGG